MSDQFSRLELLIGGEKLEQIKNARVAIFGLGGVGGSAFLALLRSGIGTFFLYDFDQFELSNLNRQELADNTTIGMGKCARALTVAGLINPQAQINTYPIFVDEVVLKNIDFTQFDFVIDAIDSVPSKLSLIKACIEHKVPLISSMGAGNRLKPEAITISDLAHTEGDPLARIIRQRLRKAGIEHLPVAFSRELPQKRQNSRVVGSSAFVANAMGLTLAAYVFRQLIDR